MPPINLSALEPDITKATALFGLILVTPQSTKGYQPQNPPNPDGSPSLAPPPPSILFHYEGEQTALLESDITDHFVEDNTAVQDQIALKPEIITTHGFIGELNDVAPLVLKPLQFVADKLTAVTAYEPELTTTAQLAYTNAFFLYQVGASALNSAVSAWNSISGLAGQSVINEQGLTLQANQSKQQSAFQQFYGYWRSRTLFTVQTPWAIFQNMAIQRLRAIQDAETNVITDFEVSFKMIRKASTLTSLSRVVSFSNRAAAQAAGLSDIGTSSPTPSISMADGLAAMA